jgi:hypothetical protein
MTTTLDDLALGLVEVEASMLAGTIAGLSMATMLDLDLVTTMLDRALVEVVVVMVLPAAVVEVVLMLFRLVARLAKKMTKPMDQMLWKSKMDGDSHQR